jgi:hypothetical protein
LVEARAVGVREEARVGVVTAVVATACEHTAQNRC